MLFIFCEGSGIICVLSPPLQAAEPTRPATDTEEDDKSEEARLEGISDTTDMQKKRKKKKVTWEFLWERVAHYSSLVFSLIMSVNYTISITSMMVRQGLVI